MMKRSLKKEIKELIKQYELDCSVRKFEKVFPWSHIKYEKHNFSTDFIIRFGNHLYWPCVCMFQPLPEDFIRKYSDRLKWQWISYCQHLSEEFIESHIDLLIWRSVFYYQKLSEDFIRKIMGKIDWKYIYSEYIVKCQPISEDFLLEIYEKIDEKEEIRKRRITYYKYLSSSFMRNNPDKICWQMASMRQNLSDDIIEEFSDKLNWKVMSEFQHFTPVQLGKYQDKLDLNLYKEVNVEKTKEQKMKEIEEYAKKYNLKYDDKYLYAYKKFDRYGRGMYKDNNFYEKNKYYKDWRLDMRKDVTYSFGFGIYPIETSPDIIGIHPEKNDLVRVKLEDWGTEVNTKDRDSKTHVNYARVWGFEWLS